MKRLSSLVLTLYALGGVVLCLGVGMVFAQVQPFSLAMPEMDQGLVLDWLLASFAGDGTSMWLGIWFLALCASVGLLVLNLCACTWTKLLPRLKNGARLQSWLLFLAHVFMIMILFGHLSQMTSGYKQENIRLLPGQSHTLPDGLRLKVERVRFEDDPKLLNLTYRQARRAQTAGAFSRVNNLAEISLWQGEQKVAKVDLRILNPLLSSGPRITLSDFYSEDSGGQNQVGAVLTITRNPLTTVFFTAYLFWIAVYLMLTIRAFLPQRKLQTNK